MSFSPSDEQERSLFSGHVPLWRDAGIGRP